MYNDVGELRFMAIMDIQNGGGERFFVFVIGG